MSQTRKDLQLETAEARIVALTKQVEELETELQQTEDCFNAVITFVLKDEDIQYLRCWNAGDFDDCRKEWPEAPRECYVGADPLFKG